MRKLREEMNVETLKQELEKERLKRLDLEQKMNEILKTRYEKRICFSYSCFQTVQYLTVNLYLLLNICIAFRPEDSPPPPPKAHGPAANGTGEL